VQDTVLRRLCWIERIVPTLETALGIFGWVWDANQDRNIRDAHGIARGAAHTAQAAESELAALRESVDRLTLMNHALWELLREHATLQDSDLLARIESIDLRDGVRDGKRGAAVSACAACGRPNRSQRPRCLYCGVSLPLNEPPAVSNRDEL
jgi:hypothetical protein